MARVPDLAEGDTITEVWVDAVTAATTIAPLRVADTAHLPTSTLEGREPGVYVYIEDVKRVVFWDGVGWMIVTEPLQTYAAATTGLTVGAGTMVGEYQRSMGWCDWSFRFTLGAGSAVGSAPTIGMPVAAASTAEQLATTVLVEDLSLDRRFPCCVKPTTSTILRPMGLTAPSSWLQDASGSFSASAPIPWATGDSLNMSGRYRMTTRYS